MQHEYIVLCSVEHILHVACTTSCPVHPGAMTTVLGAKDANKKESKTKSRGDDNGLGSIEWGFLADLVYHPEYLKAINCKKKKKVPKVS